MDGGTDIVFNSVASPRLKIRVQSEDRLYLEDPEIIRGKSIPVEKESFKYWTLFIPRHVSSERLEKNDHDRWNNFPHYTHTEKYERGPCEPSLAMYKRIRRLINYVHTTPYFNGILLIMAIKSWSVHVTCFHFSYWQLQKFANSGYNLLVP